MSDILVRPPQLRAIADQIRQRARAVQAAIDAVDQQIKALGPSRFEGSRAERVRARYNRNRQKFYNFKILLDKFAATLDEAASRFEAADSAEFGGGGFGQIDLGSSH